MKTQKPILEIPKRDFYPIHEVEQKTSLSRASIYRHARAGKIKLVKVGGRTLVPEAEIARLISGDAMNSASPAQCPSVSRKRNLDLLSEIGAKSRTMGTTGMNSNSFPATNSTQPDVQDSRSAEIALHNAAFNLFCGIPRKWFSEEALDNVVARFFDHRAGRNADVFQSLEDRGVHWPYAPHHSRIKRPVRERVPEALTRALD